MGTTQSNLAEDKNFKMLVNEDFKHFSDIVRLYIAENSPLLNPLLSLSITGHAQNGHGRFSNNFPEAHVTDVMQALRENIILCDETSRRDVSKELDRTKDFLEALVDETLNKTGNLQHYDNKEIYVESLDTQKPLFDLLEFGRRKYNIKNPEAFLRGATLAAFMDSSKYRALTQERFEGLNFDGKPMNIGYGSCVVGDREKLKKLNINMEMLSEGPLPEWMRQTAYEDGAILDINEYIRHDSDKYNPNLLNVYMRDNMGPGTCDDAALIWIGKKTAKESNLEAGIDAFFGGMLIDIVDTFDKITAFPINGGADEYFGEIINNKFEEETGKPLVSEDEITSLIYFAAKNNSPSINFSDSVRRFQQQQRSSKKDGSHHYTPIQAHLQYLNDGKMVKNLFFGYTLTPSEKFYNTLNARFNKAELKGLF